jgi:hypothetical protein
MKSIRCILSISSLLLPFVATAQERATIVGSIADGTHLPMPMRVLPAVEVRESSVCQLPDRKITFNRIANPGLPSPRPAILAQNERSPEQIEALRNSPEFQKRIKESARTTYLSISATVVDHRATFLRWWHAGKEYRAWSNADWMILTGFTDWQKDNRRFSSFLAAGRLDSTKLPADSMFRIPDDFLPEEPGTYRVIQGDSDPEAYIGMTGLHELYLNNYARLKIDLDLREQRRKEQQDELRRNPPKPQNIVLNYWKVKPQKNISEMQGGGIR